jgi:hypothetical protein
MGIAVRKKRITPSPGDTLAKKNLKAKIWEKKDVTVQ